MPLTRRSLLAMLGATPFLSSTLAESSSQISLPELPRPEVIPLYPGAAPGTEHWTHAEVEEVEGNNTIIRNVIHPALLAYRPPQPSGTAVVIAPGGAFYFLSLGNEGYDLVRTLIAAGITAFILKYRLIPSHAGWHEEVDARLRKLGWEKNLTDEIGAFATADARAALHLVRTHATNFHLDPARIGIMGFSAGGYVATSATLHNTPESRPDFCASIYGMRADLPASFSGLPPLFLAWAADDDLVTVEKHALPLYALWRQAKAPVEVHIFELGGHGFGTWASQRPSDHWLDLFIAWVGSHKAFPAV